MTDDERQRRDEADAMNAAEGLSAMAERLAEAVPLVERVRGELVRLHRRGNPTAAAMQVQFDRAMGALRGIADGEPVAGPAADAGPVLPMAASGESEAVREERGRLALSLGGLAYAVDLLRQTRRRTGELVAAGEPGADDFGRDVDAVRRHFGAELLRRPGQSLDTAAIEAMRALRGERAGDAGR